MDTVTESGMAIGLAVSVRFKPFRLLKDSFQLMALYELNWKSQTDIQLPVKTRTDNLSITQIACPTGMSLVLKTTYKYKAVCVSLKITFLCSQEQTFALCTCTLSCEKRTDK